MEGLLPLGSVIKINNSEALFMIMGYFPSSEENDEIYEYMGVPYPLGFRPDDEIFMFDGDAIGEVLFAGYENELSKQYLEAMMTVFSYSPELPKGIEL